MPWFRRLFHRRAADAELDEEVRFYLEQETQLRIDRGESPLQAADAARRALALVVLVGMAELALLCFGLVPPHYRVVAIFCNGLPIGAIWGLVFGFLEGRRTSELLGAGLSCSYIIASGFVKSTGRFVMQDWGVAEHWIPTLTGLLFLPGFVGAVWLLPQLPPPAPEDEEARTARSPMYARLVTPYATTCRAPTSSGRGWATFAGGTGGTAGFNAPPSMRNAGRAAYRSRF
jgi:hypothetical protein